MKQDFGGRWEERERAMQPVPVQRSRMRKGEGCEHGVVLSVWDLRERMWGVRRVRRRKVHSSVSHRGIRIGGFVMMSRSQKGCVPVHSVK